MAYYINGCEYKVENGVKVIIVKKIREKMIAAEMAKEKKKQEVESLGDHRKTVFDVEGDSQIL